MTAKEIYESATNGGSSDFAEAAVPVARLEDIMRGKMWSWKDFEQRSTKRKKDELDLMLIAEAFPDLRHAMPREIASQLEGDAR
jgi:hypothetical protein